MLWEIGKSSDKEREGGSLMAAGLVGDHEKIK
jgi:hypothetical protein